MLEAACIQNDAIPRAVGLYLDHVRSGRPLRDVARRWGVHASTVLRAVRKIEARRDDPLVDEALGLATDAADEVASGPEARSEARRVVALLAAPDRVLALADGMPNGVILAEGRSVPERVCVTDRAAARALSLAEWIEPIGVKGRVHRYRITPAGHAAARAAGAPTRPVAEMPLTALARRRDRDGTPFLSGALVEAGIRLFEDYESACAERVPDPDELLAGMGEGAAARVAAALGSLGPDLGDVALRVCCLLEGLEDTERRLGWSARSGKIVLRIALQRLALHYEAQGEAGMMLG